MIYIIFAIIAVAALVFFLWKRKHTPAKGTIASAMQKEIDKLTVQTRTEYGALILSQSARTNEFIKAVDAAFHRRDDIAQKHGYTGYKHPSLFTILVFPAVTQTDSNGNYSPAFKVFLDNSDPYVGSIYDKGVDASGQHYIWAAEQVINLNDGIFAIAENDNSEYCTNAVYNGLEHLLLFECDMPLYEATKDHSSGTSGHPILT